MFEETRKTIRRIIFGPSRLEAALTEDLENMQKPYRCAVTCVNAGGMSDICFVTIVCTKDDYEEGNHYAAAKIYAKNNDYEEPMVVIDEYDCGWQYLKVPDMETAHIADLRS